MNLLILTNNLLRSSYRLRISGYLSRLKAKDVNYVVEESPANRINRWRLFREARKYDAVLLHKKALNFWEAHVLQKYAHKIIYDFDDAIMYSPERPGSDKTSHFRLFERTVRMADSVIAGNEYLADHAREFCSNVHVLPTGLHTKPYMSSSVKRNDSKIRLAWIGSQSTLKYLQEICPVLETTAREDIRLALRVIADDFPVLNYMKLEKHTWSLESQAADLLVCDIGLAPLPDNRFTRGKCGFKILQYFAAGLPVIASPIGVNRDLIEKSGAGILANTPQQWQDAIVNLAQHPELRKQMGQKARQFIKQYDTEVLAGKFYHIIQTAID